jgi:hypothetical protein
MHTWIDTTCWALPFAIVLDSAPTAWGTHFHEVMLQFLCFYVQWTWE